MFNATKFGEKKCLVCGKIAKGMSVAFDDGTLNGFLCFKDMQRQAENRAEEPKTPADNGQPVAQH